MMLPHKIKEQRSQINSCKKKKKKKKIKLCLTAEKTP